MKNLPILLLIFLVSVAECATGSSGGAPTAAVPTPELPTSTAAPAIDPTLVAIERMNAAEALTATPRQQQVFDLVEMRVWRDDFRDANSSTWPLGPISNGSGTAAIDAGRYTITVSLTETFLWVYAGTDSYAFDSRIDVQSYDLTPTRAGYFGVFCRYKHQAPKHEMLYLFTMNSRNRFSIGRYDSAADPAWTSLASTDIPIDAEPTTTTSTRLRADCVGNVLSLYRNDERLLTAQDDAITGGASGLLVGTTDEGNVSVAFDNFSFTEFARSTP